MLALPSRCTAGVTMKLKVCSFINSIGGKEATFGPSENVNCAGVTIFEELFLIGLLYISMVP